MNLRSLRRPVLSGLVVFISLAPASADPPADPGDPGASRREAALESLRPANRGPMHARFDSATGAVRTLRGRFPTRTPDSIAAARSFLSANADAFGVGPGLPELIRPLVSRDRGGAVVRFEREHRGVPVFGNDLLVAFNAEEEIIHVRSEFVPGLNVAPTPGISPGEAIHEAESSLGSSFDEDRGEPRLMIVEGGKGHPGWHLAWQVRGFAYDPLGDWMIFVEARTGETIRTINMLKRVGPACVPCDPVADAPNCARPFFHGPVDYFDDPSLRDNDNVNGAQQSCALTNLTSTTNLDGLYVTTDITTPRAGPPFDADRSNNQRAVDEMVCYYHANRAKEYLNSIGFPGVMSFPIPIDAHDNAVGDNAYYDPGAIEMHFGEGGIDDGQDPDIVLHEYGHALQDNQVTGFGATLEGGSMGEGFGDYWAAALLDSQDTTLLGPGCVGSWDATAWNPYTGAFGSGCLRRLDNTWFYPRDLRYEVHDDGEIWSAGLWNLRNVLGGGVVDPLVIKAHTFLLSNANFIDGADALLSADTALYGGAYAAAINDAMKARGLPRTGTAASSSGLTQSAPFVCESAHNYASLEYKECTYTQPGASRIRFHFERLDTEAGWDFVFISDGDYNQVQVLSGAPFGGQTTPGYSAAVRGDTIVARFKADTSITDWGFRIDSVEFAEGAGEVPDGAGLPGTPLTIRKVPAGVRLEWGASCVGSDTDYAIYEGTLGAFPSHASVQCSTGGLTNAIFAPASTSTYYLVVPRTLSAEGSYGLGSDMLERVPAVSACVPQEVAGGCR